MTEQQQQLFWSYFHVSFSFPSYNRKSSSEVTWSRLFLHFVTTLFVHHKNGLGTNRAVNNAPIPASFRICICRFKIQIYQEHGGRGWGQVVSVLDFYSDYPTLNPAEAYSFFCKIRVWKELKKIEKRPGKPIKNKSRTRLYQKSFKLWLLEKRQVSWIDFKVHYSRNKFYLSKYFEQ